MKKLLLFFLTILIPTIAAADESGICGDYVTYLYSSDTNTLTISGTGAMTDYENYIDVPWWKYRDKIKTVIVEEGITRIGNCNFDMFANLTSVSLPGSLESIGLRAFAQCSSLESLELPANIKVIEDKAFTGCTSLKAINLPSGLSKINYGSFASCGLVSVTIPEGVETIGESAFWGCESLVSVNIPNSVNSIDRDAFWGCGLTSIYIPQSVKNIKENPFTNCKELKTIVVDKNNPNYDSREDCNAIIETQSNKIIIGTSNTIILEGVTSIGSYAFFKCDISTIKLPSSLKSIEDYGFSADNLKEIFVLAQIPPKIYPNSFYNKTGNCIITVPDGCSEAYNKASYWSSLGTIVEASGFKLMYVVDGEIYKIIKLQEGANVTPEPAPTREGYTFSGWSDIPSTMPANDVTVTGTFTINKYKLIYKVDGEVYKEYEVEYGSTIAPESSPIRKGFIFSGWSEIPNTMPAHDVIISGSFLKGAKCGDDLLCSYSEETKTLTISGTGDMYDFYELDNRPWKYDGIESIIIEEGVTSIGALSFWRMRKVVSVCIPSSLKRIGASSFSCCENLSSVVIPNGVIDIGEKAFDGCTNLSSVVLPNNLKSINSLLFNGCSSLSSITIPNSVTKIGGGAFANSGLSSITIPNSVTEIGGNAFNNCSLKSIYIPQSVSIIEGNLFDLCRELKTIVVDINNPIYDSRKDCNAIIETQKNKIIAGINTTVIPEGVTSIGASAFSHRDFSTILLPNSLNSIENAAFTGCIKLEEISMPDGITTIGIGAFENCVSLTSIRIPLGVSVINSDTFSGCTGLKSLTIPQNVTSIGSNAFTHTYNMKDIFVLAKIPPKIVENSLALDMKNCVITVPFGCAEAYKNTYWSHCGTIVEASGFKLMYVVDGEIYNTIELEEGAIITPEPAPTKEGYTFSGWSDIPTTMPANDVTVTGTFTINKYKLSYKVDGEVYKEYEVEYGASITPETDPTKEGYTFSGWSDIPTTMPANDVTVTGTFIINKYKLIYKVDGEVYKEYEIEYGASITPESEPTKEGYEFSGWSVIPKTMPAEDVIITGTFTKGVFKLVYIVDGEVYKTISYDYGASITPEAEPSKEGYTFSGWSDVPLTMPANDVTVTGTFTINKYKLIYKVDGEVYKEYEIEYGASITPESEPTKEGYEFSGWSVIPKTMPAEDVIITGTFTKGVFKLVYIVDGEVYKTISYDYGASITPEAEPTKEGYTFSGWSDVPLTMPANDVTVTGTFTINKYKLIYKVDGEVYKEYEIEYGASITPESEPTKEGYQFSGWSWIPNKMPAEDVIITGTFTKSAFKLIYIVDGEVYKTISYDYGASITPEADPTKEGYTFSGWSDVPSTMPANDVTVTGTFTINKYKLIYKVDGEVYKEYEIEYGASITPESEPTKEGYEFSGWSEIPPTMPAHDVVVTATFKQIDFNVDGIIYEISADGNVTIMGGDQKGNLEIAGTIQINGQPYNVTAIAENAFRDNTNIISVTIADGITAIGDNAFNGCIGLLMINIGKNVATIGNKAFANIGTYTAARTRGESSLFVNCYAENVPQTALDAFENSPVESGTLLVDDNLVDSFKTSSPWSGFGKIQGFQEAAGINSIINSPQGARIYDLQGNRLDNIRKGVNIIRTKDGKANKVMMK